MVHVQLFLHSYNNLPAALWNEGILVHWVEFKYDLSSQERNNQFMMPENQFVKD